MILYKELIINNKLFTGQDLQFIYNGYLIILNLVDAFTKFTWSQPIKVPDVIHIKKVLKKIFD